MDLVRSLVSRCHDLVHIWRTRKQESAISFCIWMAMSSKFLFTRRQKCVCPKNQEQKFVLLTSWTLFEDRRLESCLGGHRLAGRLKPKGQGSSFFPNMWTTLEAATKRKKEASIFFPAASRRRNVLKEDEPSTHSQTIHRFVCQKRQGMIGSGSRGTGGIASGKRISDEALPWSGT